LHFADESRVLYRQHGKIGEDLEEEEREVERGRRGGDAMRTGGRAMPTDGRAGDHSRLYTRGRRDSVQRCG